MKNSTSISLDDVEQIIMPTVASMWPRDFKDRPQGSEGFKRLCMIWFNQLAFEKMDCKTTMDAIMSIQRDRDVAYIPTIKTLIDQCRVEKRKSKDANAYDGQRRIVTPEEVCSREYIEIMTKVKEGSVELTDELKQHLQGLKKYYLLFHGDGWQERYKARFGAYREEFERL